jgi:hypothetical protein
MILTAGNNIDQGGISITMTNWVFPLIAIIAIICKADLQLD